ncbi:hypothetical protein [Haladaptatus sp. NG-SE-30]
MSKSENKPVYARVYVQNSEHRYAATSLLSEPATNATPIRFFGEETMG